MNRDFTDDCTCWGGQAQHPQLLQEKKPTVDGLSDIISNTKHHSNY